MTQIPTQTNELLHQFQADATVFYQKLRAFHWTVTGERFFQLHEKLEDLYTRWAEHIDAIAERTVINGGTPLISLGAMMSRASILEAAEGTNAKCMIETVVSDLKHLLEVLSHAAESAEREGSRGTANLIEEIRNQEEKALWMWSALLK